MKLISQEALQWQDELDALGPYANPEEIKALLARVPPDVNPKLVEYATRVSDGRVLMP